MKHLYLYFTTFMQKHPLGSDRESVSESNPIQWHKKQGLHEPWDHLIGSGSHILFVSLRKIIPLKQILKNGQFIKTGMAFCLRINVVPLITKSSTCTNTLCGWCVCVCLCMCDKENEQERINFKSCDVKYIPLQERNNYHLASINFPVIISISDDVTEEVHHYVSSV